MRGTRHIEFKREGKLLTLTCEIRTNRRRYRDALQVDWKVWQDMQSEERGEAVQMTMDGAAERMRVNL